MRCVHHPFATLALVSASALFAGGLQAEGAGDGSNAARIEELPPSCDYLTEPLAESVLQATVRSSPANEHIPTFLSHCAYSGQGVVRREIQYTFKFHLFELFDTASLDSEQLLFNATMASGGSAPLAMLDSPGKIAFTFDTGKQSMLMVVTGILGPEDGAGRPSEFVASYRLGHPDLSHEERLEFLLVEARRHLAGWSAR